MADPQDTGHCACTGKKGHGLEIAKVASVNPFELI